MKRLALVLALALCSVTVNAQDNYESKYVVELDVDEVDEFNGFETKRTTWYTFGETRAGHTIRMKAHRMKNVNALFVYNQTGDMGCAGGADCYGQFKFSDGTIIKLKDEASIDCDKNSSSIYFMTTEQLNYFLNKKITKFRLSKTDSYSDISPSGEYSVMDLLKAVQ